MVDVGDDWRVLVDAVRWFLFFLPFFLTRTERFHSSRCRFQLYFSHIFTIFAPFSFSLSSSNQSRAVSSCGYVPSAFSMPEIRLRLRRPAPRFPVSHHLLGAQQRTTHPRSGSAVDAGSATLSHEVLSTGRSTGVSWRRWWKRLDPNENAVDIAILSSLSYSVLNQFWYKAKYNTRISWSSWIFELWIILPFQQWGCNSTFPTMGRNSTFPTNCFSIPHFWQWGWNSRFPKMRLEFQISKHGVGVPYF